MPDRMSGLIWIQIVWHSDNVLEKTFEKASYAKKSADDNKSMKNSSACKALNSHADLVLIEKLSEGLTFSDFFFSCCFLSCSV